MAESNTDHENQDASADLQPEAARLRRRDRFAAGWAGNRSPLQGGIDPDTLPAIAALEFRRPARWTRLGWDRIGAESAGTFLHESLCFGVAA